MTEYRGEHPDKHIYILLLEMTTRLAMSFDGISKVFTKSEDESLEHLKMFVVIYRRKIKLLI